MKSKAIRYLLVTGSYALLFLWISWPLFQSAGTAIVGSGPDPYQYIWNADVFASNVLAGRSPMFTDRLAHPDGLSLWMHTYTPIIGLFNLLIGNPYLSVNLLILLQLVFGGLGAYLLARDFMRSELLAFWCGLLFAFSPYITAHLLEHVHLLMIAPVPFYIRALLRLFPQKSNNWTIHWRSLLTMAAMGVLSLLGDYYTTFFLFYATVFYLMHRAAAPAWSRMSRAWRWGGVLGIWALLHLFTEWKYLSGLDHKGAFYNSPDLFGFLCPSPVSWFYNSPALDRFRLQVLDFKGPNEQVLFLGAVLLVLALFVPRRERTPSTQALRFLLLGFLLLTVPKLKLLGHPIGYSPTASLHFIPFLNNIRNPGRFVQMVYLILPILVAYRMDHWLKPLQRSFVVLACIIMLGLEYWPRSYPLVRAEAVDPLMEELSELEGTVWYLPTGMGDGFGAVGAFDVQRLQDQLVHQRPMLGAYISRIPKDRMAAFAKQPVIAASLAVQEGKAAVLDPQDINQFIVENQLVAVILDKHSISFDALSAFWVAAFETQFSIWRENDNYVILRKQQN